jgi:hypothetical protein
MTAALEIGHQALKYISWKKIPFLAAISTVFFVSLTEAIPSPRSKIWWKNFSPTKRYESIRRHR